MVCLWRALKKVFPNESLIYRIKLYFASKALFYNFDGTVNYDLEFSEDGAKVRDLLSDDFVLRALIKKEE